MANIVCNEHNLHANRDIKLAGVGGRQRSNLASGFGFPTTISGIKIHIRFMSLAVFEVVLVKSIFR